MNVRTWRAKADTIALASSNNACSCSDTGRVRALPLYRELANSQPSNPRMFQRLATCYARLGEREEALKLIEQLRDMEQPRSRGRYPYLIGMIYATLDEKEKAMQYLKQAHREGYGFGPGTYQNAFELIPLHGYPPYEAFVAPKG